MRRLQQSIALQYAKQGKIIFYLNFLKNILNSNFTGIYWLLNSTGMCCLCYTLLCVICATQDGDASAISSPFNLLLMRSRGLGRVGGYESDNCKKNTESPATLCFILTPYNTTQILSIPYQMLASCILPHYEPIFYKKFGSFHSKFIIQALENPFSAKNRPKKPFSKA